MARFPMLNRVEHPGMVDWGSPTQIAEADRWMHTHRDYKDDLIRRADRNGDFYRGNQWRRWVKTFNRWDNAPRSAGEVRLTYNLIKPTVEQRLARMIRAEPIISARTETNDAADRAVSRTVAQVLNWYWLEGIPMRAIFEQLLLEASMSPIAFLHVFWNPLKGPERTVLFDEVLPPESLQAMPPESREPALADARRAFARSFGEQAAQSGRAVVPGGDVDASVETIRTVSWWPFNPRSAEDVRVWRIASVQPAQAVADRYGLDVEEVRALSRNTWVEDLRNGTRSHRGELRSTTLGRSAGVEGPRLNDEVAVSILYALPSRDLPRGAQAVVVGGSDSALPHTVGPLSSQLNKPGLFPLVESPVPGRFTGTNTVDQLIPLQQNLNIRLSQIATYLAHRTNPTLYRIKGDGADAQGFSNAPGVVNEVNSRDMVPGVVAMPDIGGDYWRLVDNDIRAIRDIGGVSSVDLGQTDDANVRSGVAINTLAQLNETRMLPLARSATRVALDAMDYVLAELQAKLPDERAVHIVGDDNASEIIRFRAADLTPQNREGGAPRVLIRVIPFEQFPSDPVQTRNFIRTMTEAGFLVPGRDDDLVFRLWGGSNAREVQDKDRPHERRQLDEIDQWKSGLLVGAPSRTDDDTVHLRVLDEWMAGDEYAKTLGEIASTSPLVAQAVAQDMVAHRDAHRMAIQRKLLEAPYIQREADFAVWSERRAAFIARMTPQVGPEEAARLANLVLPFPFTLVGAQVPPGGGSPGSSRSPRPPSGGSASTRPGTNGRKITRTGDGQGQGKTAASQGATRLKAT